jgi:trimeric autotransporter adhesin
MRRRDGLRAPLAIATLAIVTLTLLVASVVPASATGWWPGFSGPGPGMVFALARYNGQLYAGGGFTLHTADGDARNIARWDGAAWHPVGAGLDNAVHCLTTYGGSLVAGGEFDVGVNSHGVARWDGTAWQPLGRGADGWVHALCEYDGWLYAGGDFHTVGDGLAAAYVARWNGATWSALGSGTDLPVRALAVYRSELWLGGSFRHAGGLEAAGLARFGSQFGWATAPGTAFDGSVLALAVYEGDLVAGGDFGRAATSVWSPYAARFNYDRWTWSAFYPNGGGPGALMALTPFGTALAGGGSFGHASGALYENIALAQRPATPTYSSPWMALGSGTDGPVYALVADGISMYVGGTFTTAGGMPAAGVARWDGDLLAAVPVSPAPRAALEAWPNPFVDRIAIRLAMPSATRGAVDVRVRDLQGRTLRRLTSGAAADARELQWDGCDDAGHRVPAGVYWIDARGEGIASSCRVLRIE